MSKPVDLPISIYAGPVRIPYQIRILKSGEVQPKVDPYTCSLVKSSSGSDHVTIIASIANSTIAMAVLMLCDALQRSYPDTLHITLVLPYLPYGRQESRCAQGEAVGKYRFLSLLKESGVTSIVTWDIYSRHAESEYRELITNVEQPIIFRSLIENRTFGPSTVFVALDERSVARAKAMTNAAHSTQKVITLETPSDPVTGELGRTKVVGFDNAYTGDLEPLEALASDGVKFVVVADICDEKQAFIKAAYALEEAFGARHIELCVTHAIFSDGVDALLARFKHIYVGNYVNEEDATNKGYVFNEAITLVDHGLLPARSASHQTISKTCVQ